MRKNAAGLLAIPCISAMTIGLACSSNNPQPIAPTSFEAGIGFGQFDGGGAPPPNNPAPPASSPPFFTGQPDAGAPPPAASTAPAVTDQVLDTGIDLAINTVVPKVAPNMKLEGAPGRATLKEGEHFGMVVTLQPNACYTFVGFSPPGSINQLDITLMGIPLNVQAGKSGAADKTMPGISVMGKGKDAICPISLVPLPYKVDVAATKGAGRMGVHVFTRSK